MKRTLALMAIGLVLASTANSQNESHPDTLTELSQAAHCMISAGHDKPRSQILHGNPKVLNLGSYVDTTSYPGERVLYIVDYPDPKETKGVLYVYFLRQRKGKIVYRFENNGIFIHKKKKEVEFLDPPLGGVWTQEHIEAAIDRIEKQPKVELFVKDLRGSYPGVVCESYADPQ